MSKKTKAVSVASVALMTVLIGALTLSAQVRNGSDTEVDTEVYDNFNSKWLDPNKWTPMGDCWGGKALECVREIQDGKLRLAIRGVGDRNSDSGDQFASSFLGFNSAVPFHSITATVTIRSANGGTCSTNPFTGVAKATMGGAFFNPGTGNSGDDIHAFLVLSSYSTLDPTMLDVGGWIGSGNGVNIWTHMGNYPKGTQIVGTVAWDQANHQFVFTVKPREGQLNQVAVPYYLPDSQPPVSSMQVLDVDADPANCSSALSFAHTDARFDNVIVK